MTENVPSPFVAAIGGITKKDSRFEFGLSWTLVERARLQVPLLESNYQLILIKPRNLPRSESVDAQYLFVQDNPLRKF